CSQQLSLKLLTRSQGGHSFRGWPFQIDRDAVGQLHQAIQLLSLYSWHELEMEVSSIVIAPPKDLGGIDDLVLRRDAAPYYTGRKESPLCLTGPLKPVKAFCQLIRPKGDSLGTASAGTKGAVVTISLAGGSNHRLQHRTAPLWCHHRSNTVGKAIWAR